MILSVKNNMYFINVSNVIKWKFLAKLHTFSKMHIICACLKMYVILLTITIIVYYSVDIWMGIICVDVNGLHFALQDRNVYTG